jgi:signal transduction histidine kinase
MPAQEQAQTGNDMPGLWVMLLAALIFWFVFVSLATTYAVFTTGYRYRLANIPLDASLISLGAVFSLGLYAVLRRLTGYRFPVQVVMLTLLLLIWAVPFQLLFGWIVAAFGGKPLKLPAEQFVLSQSLFWLAPFGLWTAMILALLHDRVARSRDRRLALVEAQAREAQLRALRYQVNPHFLYNTLNAIAALILDGKAEAAEAMVLRLSNFFRTSLANDPTSDVPLAHEIALQRVYLEIEQARFEDRLTVEIDIADDVATAFVPSLILQPLVENALKHGCSQQRGGSLVRISGRKLGGLLRVEVSDDGPGRSAIFGTGTGLSNVRQRLHARFETAASLEAGPNAEGGYTAAITLPLEHL